MVESLKLFEAGKPITAKQWNAVAKAINALWDSRAELPFELVKGEPWVLRLRQPILTGLGEDNQPAGAGVNLIELPACNDGTPSTIYVPGYLEPL
jgi:hypothetical protein